ncbi:MAG: 3-hydroxyacyl-CoA dehydrogenase NAD-binding domain-containing protein, partial [Hyphomicrobiales bacterium]
LGRKTGKGIYVWKNGKAQKQAADGMPPRDLQDRLLLPMLNACVACLREGVVESEEAIDGGMIFGTGFAPFRAGPLHYARARGLEDVVAKLEELSTSHGPRFRPDAGWKDLTAS